MKYFWDCINKPNFSPRGYDCVEQVFTAKLAKKGYDKIMECEWKEFTV